MITSRQRVNPLTMGPSGLLHGVWAEDPSWQIGGAPPVDGANVTSWRNASGGGDPANPTGAQQPLFRQSTSAFGGRSTVQFDGSNDFLTFNITDITAACYLVFIASFGTIVATTSQYAIGIGSPNFAGFGLDGGSGKSMVYPGTGTPPKSLGTMTAGVPQLGACGWKLGASGWLKLNNEAKQTGNTGAVSMTEFVLGAGWNGVAAATYLPGHIHFAAVYSADPTVDSKWEAIKVTARQCGVAIT